MLEPNFLSCTAPTKAMIMPTRKLMRVTMGSAWAPHSWTTTARSRQRKRARRVSSRPKDIVASPRNATAFSVDSQPPMAPTPRRAIKEAGRAGGFAPSFSDTVPARVRRRCGPLGSAVRSTFTPRSLARSSTLVRNASTPESQCSSASVSKVTARGGGSSARACSTGLIPGRPLSSDQAPASRTTSVPSGPRVTSSRSSSAATARRSPELLTTIFFRAQRFLLAPRRYLKLDALRRGVASPAGRDELDPLAAHESEALHPQAERGQLARGGIARPARAESAQREGRDPQHAAPGRPRLVVVEQHHGGARGQPAAERSHERLALGGSGAGAEEGDDRRGRNVGGGDRHVRAERSRQAVWTVTDHGQAAVERTQQLERAGRQRARHRRAISVMNSSRVFWFDWKLPSIALVVTREFCFSTPRMRMQRCSASSTTPTPAGSSCSWIVFAICVVMRSCTWRRRANTSTRRATLLMPTMRSRGM